MDTITYVDDWNLLINYLKEADIVFFVREGVVEIVVDDKSIFIHRRSVFSISHRST